MSTKPQGTGDSPAEEADSARPAQPAAAATPFGIGIAGSAPEHAIEIPISAAPELADLASIFTDLITASMAAHHVNEPAGCGHRAHLRPPSLLGGSDHLVLPLLQRRPGSRTPEAIDATRVRRRP
jgi:hypothetical protein